jgi:hypothetical protein
MTRMTRMTRRLLEVLLFSLPLGACGGTMEDSTQLLVGRYEMRGKYINTREISAQSPGCGPLNDRESYLDGGLTITRRGGSNVLVHEVGPGCTVVAHAVGDGLYQADGGQCVLDPQGRFATWGWLGMTYRTFRLDLNALTWSYESEMTWPNGDVAGGVAKVCGFGTAMLIAPDGPASN